jgi:DNA-binding NtrC family response regulator
MNILIADDDKNLRTVLSRELSDEGHNLHETGSGGDAVSLVDKDDYDVVILDLNMPGLGGIEVLKKIKALGISAEVIILTGHAAVSTAVEAMKLGAYDYLEKPFKMEELKAVAEKAYEKKKLRSENLLLKAQIKRQTTAPRIITDNPVMMEILDTIKIVAVSDFPVLICGESGVGKELVARAIHEASDRSEGPFITINCGAIPENMLESELFGHEKGAFTGAYERKLGLIEMANNGILFLDEIGELSPQLQGKLLRVIEGGVFFRVGGVKELKVDVKFVSATNKDIKGEVEAGSFRADLYYRISALTVNVPPLRERRDDIPRLVQYFIGGNPAFKDKEFSSYALDAMAGYSWPGNVRELQNVVHRALLLSKGRVIDRSDLPQDITKQRVVSGRRLEDIERDYILKVMREVDGQKGKAAEILGIDPKTLYRKLSAYEEKE